MKLEFGATPHIKGWGEIFVVILKTEGDTHYLHPTPELFEDFISNQKPVPRQKDDIRKLGFAEIIADGPIEKESLSDAIFLLECLAMNAFWCVPSRIDTDFVDNNVESIRISFSEGSLDDPIKVVLLGGDGPAAIDSGEHPFYPQPHSESNYRKYTETPIFACEINYEGNQDESTKSCMKGIAISLGITPERFKVIKQININFENQNAKPQE